MKRNSLAEIARNVGVSKTVVYTVLNNRIGKGVYVSDSTKSKIIQTAKDLDYFAPKSAKELSTGRSNRIGILFSQMIQPFSDLIVKIQQECSKSNYEIVPYATGHNIEVETELLESFRDSRVDGIIILGGGPANILNYKEYTKKPYNYKILYYGNSIYMEEADKVKSGEIPLVHFNGEQAGMLAAEHFFKTGCKRIAFLGSYKNTSRERGFVEFLEKNTGVKPIILVDEKKTFDSNAAKELAKKVFDMKKIPDGVFTNNDFIGMTLMCEAYARGLRIPDDISIIGCDNTILCNYTSPEMTSIDTNVPRIVEHLTNTMLAMINGEKNIPSRTLVDVSISVKGSTKKYL